LLAVCLEHVRAKFVEDYFLILFKKKEKLFWIGGWKKISGSVDSSLGLDQASLE